jgi:hypothetical protein
LKRFGRRQACEAIAYAQSGGQALHVYPGIKSMPAPRSFHKSVLWAHLFDQDGSRLRATARKLGVRRIEIHQAETEKQHLDLCGKPLQCAIKMAVDGR